MVEILYTMSGCALYRMQVVFKRVESKHIEFKHVEFERAVVIFF